MITLPILEKTRCINKILQKATGQYVDYKEISEVLKNVIHANVYIVDQVGRDVVYSAKRLILKQPEIPED